MRKPEVSIVLSETDDTWVVQIDTDENYDGEPVLRIYLNDACLHENPKFPALEREIAEKLDE